MTRIKTEPKEIVAPTAGVIVLFEDKVLLVETKATSNWGFPKGSREKGESSITNALRELKEESGLSEEDINLVQRDSDRFVTFDEKTPKNTLSCRYFVAHLSPSAVGKQLSAMNPQEVFTLGFYTCKEAFSLLKPSRQAVLQKALDYTQADHRPLFVNESVECDK